MYNPLLHKRPYGATAVGVQTHITFPLDPTLGVKRVFCIFRKIYEENGEPFSLELNKIASDNEDVFELTFALSEAGIYMYRFEGELEDGTFAFFGRSDDGTAVRGDWLPEWQLTVSKYAYKTPDWAKNGVTYQIFADRFCKVGERPFNKRGRVHTYWNERPDIQESGKDYRADDFFGGNIKGIISRLDYLSSLGVTLIYLSPIFESSSNHRYDTGDYLRIDEFFGSEEEFDELVEKAKKYGIRIMLDGVFNHTGADSLYFNKFGNYPTLGAYQSPRSPYYDWYYFTDYPDFYRCWWGSTVVPTVNKTAYGFRQLILGNDGVIDKWSKKGVSGWRLDVVDELPIDFTDDLCQRIRQEGDDMLIVGEVWEDASVKVSYDKWRPYFMGDQLHSVMNYPFKEAIIDLTLTNDIDKFKKAVSLICEHYPKQSLDVLMNLVGSHDTVRALTVLSGVKPPESKRERADFKLSKEEYALARKRLEFASALQYLLPGVPCIYYGDEAGVQGFEDPLNRAAYPWGREDEELIKHYRRLGDMRKRYKELLQGELHFEPDEALVVFDRRSPYGTLRVYANASDKTYVRGCEGVDAMSGKKINSRIRITPCSVRAIVLD